MKFDKLYIVLLLAMTTLFVGCSDWEDTVEPSPTVPEGNPAIRFDANNSSDILLDPAITTEFTLTVKRNNESDALEVPVIVVTNTENSFAVPEKVSFAAGSATASLTIVMTDDAPKGKALPITLKFDDAQTNPYLPEYSAYYGSVYISDWETAETGTYTSWWTETSWTHDLEYSPANEQYRFRDLLAEGYHFVFEWDGANEITPIPEKVESGYVHSTYGMVSATTEAATYDEATKTFTFTRKWTVDAGSFGSGDDTYTID